MPWSASALVAASGFTVDTLLGLMTTYFLWRSTGRIWSSMASSASCTFLRRSSLRWLRPRRVFVNSMSDLFHADVPAAYIDRVFDVMCRADWHQYQVLTKRSERLLELNPVLKWQPQIWMGVSVENEDYLFRVEQLKRTGAKIKFLSIEPLLGPLRRVNLRGIDWVIVGGESGPGARPVDPEWVREIRDRCTAARVP